MQIDRTYINLTNGLEALGPRYTIEEVSFVRIQSTWCEQKRWSEILVELEVDLLMRLAIGQRLAVVDFSAKHDVPRALWQGLPWIAYACQRSWFGVAETPIVRGMNVSGYFAECWHELQHAAVRKLRYFARYAQVGGALVPIGARTDHDGAYDWFVHRVHAEVR